MKNLTLLTLILISASGFWAYAQTSEDFTRTDQGASLEEREKVKKRLYPGGRDEESLQVQQQLNAQDHAAVQSGTSEPVDPDDHD